MVFTRFTEESRDILARAHEIAWEAGHGAVCPEHVLLALLGHRDMAIALADYLVDVAGLKETLRGGLAAHGHAGKESAVLEPSVHMEVFLREVWERVKAGLRYQVRVADLVHGLLDEESASSIRNRLPEKGLKIPDLQKGLLEHLPGHPRATEAAPKYRNLRAYARCLTDQARDGLLDPVIGRHHEVRRLMQVLCRRSKNNPVLVGPPGIGKAAIVEALALRIAEGDGPQVLKGKDIFAVDLTLLTAGADFRGVLDDRVKGLLNDVRQSRGNAILFMEEISAMLRAGAGGADLGASLRPALAAGDLRCIGLSTPDEYRHLIEKDAVLATRFHAIQVSEPSLEEAMSILRGVKERYEAYHDVGIADSALNAAVLLSRRFVQDRWLPDKAIDLLDEAAAKVRIEWDALPADVDAAGRRAGQMETELRGLSTTVGKEQARRMAEELARLRSLSQEGGAGWQAQAALARRIAGLRARLAWHEMVASQAEPLGWAAERTKRARQVIGQERHALAADEAELASLQQERRLFKTQITEEDIAEVVAGWTGIPLSKLLENERAKLLSMEGALHRRVVGQEGAIVAVSNAVRLARAGMKDPNRPVGSFLFLGPTGVGKTELCRAVAEFLFDDEGAMVRIDMSEYMDKHTVSRLIGAPPGYIGYDDSGQLTETVRRKPYSVVLFDEIEKAHPDVFNILLQIMDDGRLTDGHGRTVDFKNAIVTLTSNVGGHLYREHHGKQGVDLHAMLSAELRTHFRPEFLNRLDAIVFFDLLTENQIEQIVDIQVAAINRRLAGGGIRLEVEEAVKGHLAKEGYDVLQGARPLKRLIQHEILEPLALKVLQGKLKDGDTVTIRLGRGRKKELHFHTHRTEDHPRSVNGSGKPLELGATAAETSAPSQPV